MCGTCGCAGETAKIDGQRLHHNHDHHHHHHHDDHHDSGAAETRLLRVERDLLAKNDALAADNRARLAKRSVFALNLVSSPGSGKTSLLTRSLTDLAGDMPMAVIEGDQQTDNDAARIRATGVDAVQVNTGAGCHLDAHMIGHAMDRLDLAPGAVLFIENVGNLVCPSAFDLGEAHKVVVLSVTEGEDKPLKYPNMFEAADLMLLNKADLLPYLDFDTEACIAYARRINPRLEVLTVSAKTGAGMSDWYAFIKRGAALIAPAAE